MSMRIEKAAVLNAVLLAAFAGSTMTLSACTSDADASVARAQRADRAPRVETTGSLINRAVVAHVDDDGDTDANASNSATQTGARSVGELLNGSTGSMGSKTNQIK
jgi:hypothetical protein